MSSTALKHFPLVEIADIRAGYPFRGAIDALEQGDVGAIQMRNVDEVIGVNWNAIARVKLPSQRSADLLATGDLIFTTRGRRNFALALDRVPCAAVCSPHFFVIRVFDETQVMPSFLAWQINQRSCQDYLQQAATGSHILNITRGAIESLPLALPSLDMQRSLMAVVTTAQNERRILNELISNRTRQIDAIAAEILKIERHISA
ncbi:restriction endonuclease subunit S [Sphingorhabdus lacus]|uniref:Restriction endonuclease subunit S n=1 Tax=Sphingorhabdus lacus TaxID=392610 RepID=A0A6I6L643_9SPHN|nr:restriction endonuclease subunit S [Sphingorhabdus lacus]QGY81279.1 restriction endonuclease subunit S [Sphingorhabdus lacus]